MTTCTKLIRGLNTAWLQAGEVSPDKPILLFLHGFPDLAETWEPQLTHFAKTHLVLAPYLRGAGKSDPSDDLNRYDLEAVALDHLEILRSIDPDGKRRVALVAHDIGAPHAWRLASLLKERLCALVVINGPSLTQMRRKLRNLGQLRRSWYIGAILVPGLADFVLDRWGKKILGRKEGFPTPDRLSSLLGHYRAAARRSFSPRMREDDFVDGRVLMLWGKDDPYLLPPQSSEVEGLAKHCTVRVLDGGHWIHRQQPERVNRLIEEFLMGGIAS